MPAISCVLVRGLQAWIWPAQPMPATTTRQPASSAQFWRNGKATVGWAPPHKRAGSTFRTMPDASNHGLYAAAAMDLMLAQPSMIKRSVPAVGDRLLVGFRPALYEAVLGFTV